MSEFRHGPVGRRRQAGAHRARDEELKDKPEAQAAVKQAMAAYEKAIQAAIEGMAKAAPKMEFRKVEGLKNLQVPQVESKQPMVVRVAEQRGRMGVHLEPIPTCCSPNWTCRRGRGC